MFCFGNHVREKELCRLTQCGIGTRAKKLHIRFESVMVPHLQRDPDARRDKQSPAESSTGRRIPPCVRNCVATHPGAPYISFAVLWPAMRRPSTRAKSGIWHSERFETSAAQ